MRRSVSVAILISLVFATCIPGFAQKVRPSLEPVKPSTTFERVAALTDGRGVLVQWEMELERNNIGFNVYRVGPIDTFPVNTSIILGAAGSSQEIVYGGRYQIFDPIGTEKTQYVIHTIRSDGSSIASKIANVSTVKDLEAATGASSATWLQTVDPPGKNITGGAMDLHPELRQLVEESAHTPDLTNHRWVVSQPGVKIAVRKEGMYRVTSGELSSAGFNTEADDSNIWSLFSEGNEQAIFVAPGGSYIEFYGKPIDTPESDTRVYYLIKGSVPGKRMETRVLRSFGGPSFSTSYPVTVVKKERFSYVNHVLNGDAENYFGTLLSTSRSTIPFDLTGVENTGDVTVTVRLQAYSKVDPVHSVRVVLNGQELAPIVWNGILTAFTRTYTLPATALVDGRNNLDLTTQNSGEFELFDTISVTHKRRYQAEQNKVGFFTPGLRKVEVTGFSSANVRVFDTTAEGDPKLIVNLPVVQDGATFKVTLPSSRNIVAYALDDSALLASASVTANKPSNYSASTTPYDLLIISHGSSDFMTASESWANYRRDQGFTAKVVDVADIYDEFGYGSASAESIKAFLTYTYTNWPVGPKYVMLMGDATHDPRNYEGYGNWDLIPSKHLELLAEETVSDEALADFNADGLAEMPVGRIPARSLAFINTAYGKMTSFETLENQSLDRGALFAHDLPVGWDFEAVSHLLADEMPASMPRTFVGRNSPTAQQELLDGMSEGKFIVNYAGHGSLSLWASSSFFSGSSVYLLNNTANPTFFTMLTCLNGYFIVPSPNYDSIAEQLMQSPIGGGVGAWASTAATTPDVQQVMAQRFYRQLAAGEITRVGDLILDAKTVIPAGDVRYSWVLFGDPMLKMR